MAGSVTCNAICSWDNKGQQWHALGDGVHGDAAVVDFAGVRNRVFVAPIVVLISLGLSQNSMHLSLVELSLWRMVHRQTSPSTA